MNSVFEIKQLSHEGHSFRYSAEIDATHTVFRGHFPQAPVVPGVCTMNMIKECIAHAISISVRYDYIKECKFLSAIIPSKHKILTVDITLKQENEQMSVVAIVSAEDATMIKLKATLL